MAGERGGEITSDAFVIHYCDRWIVFDRQKATREEEAWENFLANVFRRWLFDFGQCLLLGLCR